MPLDVNSILNEYGLTIGLFTIAGTSLMVLITLSIREFVFWFFRLNKVMETQNQILKEIQELRSQKTDEPEVKQPKADFPLEKNSEQTVRLTQLDS